MEHIEHGTDPDGPTLELVDSCGDRLDVWRGGAGHVSLVPSGDMSSLWLDHEGATALFQYLGEYLNTSEVPTCCPGDDDDCRPETPAAVPSVLEEAQAAIYGDREADYGSPRDNWTRTAILWTGLLQHKLADGEYITPEDGLRCMVAVKLARDVNSPKRDNRVDGAGYLALLDRLETGK